MIKLLINDCQVRQTADALEVMLNNDSGDVLLLAHGYMDLQTLTDLKLAEWLDRRKERRIDLLVGLHDRGEVGCTSENPMRVEKTFEKLLRTWNLPSDARNRLLIYAVEHFHAKFTVVGRFVSDQDLANAFTMDQTRTLFFTPLEVVFGSSNLTNAALRGPNVELDAHIPRDSPAIAAFASKMHTVLSRAVELANKPYTFSNEFTLLLRSILDDQANELALRADIREQRAMEAYSNVLINNLMDPDK